MGRLGDVLPRSRGAAPGPAVGRGRRPPAALLVRPRGARRHRRVRGGRGHRRRPGARAPRVPRLPRAGLPDRPPQSLRYGPPARAPPVPAWAGDGSDRARSSAGGSPPAAILPTRLRRRLRLAAARDDDAARPSLGRRPPAPLRLEPSAGRGRSGCGVGGLLVRDPARGAPARSRARPARLRRRRRHPLRPAPASAGTRVPSSPRCIRSIRTTRGSRACPWASAG